MVPNPSEKPLKRKPKKRKRRRRRRGISFKVTLAVAILVALVLFWRGSGYYELGWHQSDNAEWHQEGADLPENPEGSDDGLEGSEIPDDSDGAIAGEKWTGPNYYQLDIDERPEHPGWSDLRAHESTGLVYGLVGTLLIFTNLLYLARRRLAGFRRFGSMRTWLDLHVFTGLVGATFVAYHSTFQARALVNQITAVSLIIVVISGLIGRFFYALIPKPDANPYREALEDLEEAVPGLTAQIEAAVAAHPPEETRGDPALLRTLKALPGWRRTAHERRQAVSLIVANAPAIESLDPRAKAHVKRLSRRLARAAALEAYGVAADAMLRAWRPIHRLFAFIMILTVLTHIGVAWFFGYADIF